MKKSRREAISPLIATIIIVAVTIAIALAVAAWLMGLWTIFVGGPRVSASLVGIFSNGTVTIVFSNTGSVADDILGATISNATWSSTLDPTTGSYPITIPIGKDVIVDFSVRDTSEPVAGREYTVEIALKSGGKLALTGVCKTGKTA